MKDIFRDVVLYKRDLPAPDQTFSALYFCDDQGRDWYEARRGWEGAVAVNAGGVVCSVARDQSSVELFTMVEGQTVYQVEPAIIPDDPLGRYIFNGEAFTLIPNAASVPARTKEEILADLDQLRAELVTLDS